MKILVTGGAGFIGSHIVKQLLEANHQVIVYDDFSTTKRSVIPGGVYPGLRSGDQESSELEESGSRIESGMTIVEGNVKDSKLLVESLTGVDAVIHMASFISVEESVKDPLKYMDNNVLGTACLLTAMREAGVKKIVFSSSATVYGEPKSLPILENAPLSAANPYAASKIAMEALCESFYKTDGFNVTILRYFNPYGPGEDHRPETHAIPNIIKAALSQDPKSAVIPGGVYPGLRSGDQESSGIEAPGSRIKYGMTNKKPIPLYWKGEQVRDFIYVEDLAEAHIRVLGDRGDMGNLGEKGRYEVFNVGSESGVKVIDVINVLSDILGYELNIEDLGERPGDVMANYASSAKLKEATGWEAKVGLEEGLRKTVEWFKEEMGDKGDRGN